MIMWPFNKNAEKIELKVLTWGFDGGAVQLFTIIGRLTAKGRATEEQLTEARGELANVKTQLQTEEDARRRLEARVKELEAELAFEVIKTFLCCHVKTFVLWMRSRLAWPSEDGICYKDKS